MGLGFSLALQAQTRDHRWSWSNSLTLNNYQGATLGAEGLSLKKSSLGYATGLRYYVSPWLNIGTDFGVGNIDIRPSHTRYDETFFNTYGLAELKLNNGVIIKEDALIQPYLMSGLGVFWQATQKGNKDQDNAGKFQGVVGGGIKIPYTDRFTGIGQVSYHSTTDQDILNFDMWQMSLGVAYNFGPSYDKIKDSDGDGVANALDNCPDEFGDVDNFGCPKPADADNDGIADEVDKCPNVAGLKDLYGCPDSDGDGITDSEDKCATVAGLASLSGCPDSDGDGVEDGKDICPDVAGLATLDGCPDADGDGVADSKDLCPNQAGSEANRGCPDTDQDGIIDIKDACPNEAGIAKNNGCPEIDEETKTILVQALEGIRFKSGTNIVTQSSFGKLDNVVKIMKTHPEYNIKVSGYTDSAGREESNLLLSEKRAQAVKEYLAGHGISESRISAKGYGEANPIADNATAAGRAKNRRVEFEIVFD